MGSVQHVRVITPNFQVLKGLAIKAGWTQKTRELLGGTRGCTHLLELLGPMATTAFQTVYPLRARREREQGVRKRPGLLDSCHAWASDSADTSCVRICPANSFRFAFGMLSSPSQPGS
jgi:hypothetical protein